MPAVALIFLGTVAVVAGVFLWLGGPAALIFGGVSAVAAGVDLARQPHVKVEP